MNYIAMKRAVVIGLAFSSFFLFSAAAQETLQAPSALALYPPAVFGTLDSSTLIRDLPLFPLLDGRRLPVSTDMGRMGTAPLYLYSAALSTGAPMQAKSQTRTATPVDGKDSLEEIISSPLHTVYATGEVGVLYGRWSGKSSGDLWQTYMLGEVGNDKFHITVGAAYEESSVRGARYRVFTPSW